MKFALFLALIVIATQCYSTEALWLSTSTFNHYTGKLSSKIRSYSHSIDWAARTTCGMFTTMSHIDNENRNMQHANSRNGGLISAANRALSKARSEREVVSRKLVTLYAEANKIARLNKCLLEGDFYDCFIKEYQ